MGAKNNVKLGGEEDSNKVKDVEKRLHFETWETYLTSKCLIQSSCVLHVLVQYSYKDQIEAKKVERDFQREGGAGLLNSAGIIPQN